MHLGPWGRLWALLALSDFTLLETVHILWTGHAAFSGEVVLKTLLVPAVQTLGLLTLASATGNLRALADDRRIERFLAYWLVLVPTLSAANAAVEILLLRRVDWTDAAFFLLLVTPAAQAASLTLPVQSARRTFERLRALRTYPAAPAIACVDFVILSAGWAAADHPLIGIAIDGSVQRRWMGLKLVAAGVVCAWLSLRSKRLRPRAPVPRALLAASVVLAAFGIDGLTPWISGLIARDPATLALWPTLWHRMLVNAAVSAIGLTVALRARAAFALWSADAAMMFAAGAMAVFVGTLALAMNGFLGVQPVYPWGAIATTSGSVAASLFLVGSVIGAASVTRAHPG